MIRWRAALFLSLLFGTQQLAFSQNTNASQSTNNPGVSSASSAASAGTQDPSTTPGAAAGAKDDSPARSRPEASHGSDSATKSAAGSGDIPVDSLPAVSATFGQEQIRGLI